MKIEGLVLHVIAFSLHVSNIILNFLDCTAEPTKGCQLFVASDPEERRMIWVCFSTKVPPAKVYNALFNEKNN